MVFRWLWCEVIGERHASSHTAEVVLIFMHSTSRFETFHPLWYAHEIVFRAAHCKQLSHAVATKDLRLRDGETRQRLVWRNMHEAPAGCGGDLDTVHVATSSDTTEVQPSKTTLSRTLYHTAYSGEAGVETDRGYREVTSRSMQRNANRKTRASWCSTWIDG